MSRDYHICRRKSVMLFLLPNLSGFLLFIFIPVIVAVILSFFRCDLFSAGSMSKWTFVGLENFKNIIGFHIEDNVWKPDDPFFWKTMWNTIFLLLRIPLSMGGAFLLAVLLHQPFRRNRVYKTILFLPTICAGTAVYIVWRWIFNFDFGLINYIIEKLSFGNVGKIPWLVDPDWAKPSFILMNLWIELGGINLLLYLSALNAIPDELYEAAEIDGANWWYKLKNITIPMTSGTSFFILIMNLITGFQQGFQQANIITRGGPAGSTTTISYYIYQQVYVWNHMGYGAALAIVLFLIVLILTGISWLFGNRTVFYMGK